MHSGIVELHQRWGLAALLQQYPSLRIVPSQGEELELNGRVAFHVRARCTEPIADEYEVEISVPPGFPAVLPRAKEVGKRIPAHHHRNPGGWLCLGTPTEMRVFLFSEPTLPNFVTRLLIPYLYAFSHLEKHGQMPFGEQRHGKEGIRDYLAKLYRAPSSVGIEEFVRLTGMRRRRANKRPCPCQSGRRLGRCHNRVVNALRLRFGRLWFAREYKSVRADLG